jgi:hypothetical protein
VTLDRLEFGGGALAQRHRLARDEEHLTDRQAVLERHALAGLQHVAELGLVRVPVGLDPHREHRRQRPLESC